MVLIRAAVRLVMRVVAALARRGIAIVIGNPRAIGPGRGAAFGPGVPNVDLGRCSGHWSVIANIPYFAEKGNAGGYFDISLQVDDTLADVYSVHSMDFRTPQNPLL
jgi:hypothetical protein